MLALPSLLPLAIKYASKLGRIHLAEKLGELLPQFEEKEKENEKYDENEAARELLLSTPVANNLIRSNLDKYSTPPVVPVNLHHIFANLSFANRKILFFRNHCQSAN